MFLKKTPFIKNKKRIKRDVKMPNEIIPYNNKLKTLARELRKNSTLSEVLLWKVLKGKALGLEFHRQVPMLNYIVDFYCHEIKLAIEVDGSSHDSEEAIERDALRQEEIEKYGVQFLRIPDKMVKKEMINVMRMLESKLSELKEKHLPAPSRDIGKGSSKGDGKRIAALQYITQPIAGVSAVEQVRELCSAGVKWIQLRLKDADEFVWEQEAIEIWEACQDFGATFIINDNVAVAKRVMADGVHLGKDDMKPSEARKILGTEAIIGGTANTFQDIITLQAEGVDYIGLGPFKQTETKKNLSPVLGIAGYEGLLAKCKQANITIPIVGVGGIALEDINLLRKSGLHGVAVSGILAKANNKKELVSAIYAELKI
jgi:thiamine-phosphate pyrophosphorylase